MRPHKSARLRGRVRGRDLSTVTLAVAIVLFAGLLLATSDYLGRTGAQSLLAHAVQQDTGARQRPSVHLHGTFFLPQVVHGIYDDVEIDVGPVQSGPLRIADVHAHLKGVYLSFHDVLTRNTDRLLIRRTTETVTLRYHDLDQYLTAVGAPLSITYEQAPGQVKLTGTVTILGKKISASGAAKVTASDGTLNITPTQLDSGVSGLDDATRLLLGQRFTVHIPLQALPFGQHITEITTHSNDITVLADGSDVILDHQ